MLNSVHVKLVNKDLANIFKDMSQSDKNIVVETAILYYAKYIEENPGVENYVYDRDLINAEEDIKPIRVDYYKASVEDLKAEALYCLNAYIDGKLQLKASEYAPLRYMLKEIAAREKFSTYPPKDIEVKEYKKPSESEYIRLKCYISNMKVRRIISCVCSKTNFVKIFIENALTYYIELLKSNPAIVDLRLASKI